MFLDISYWHSSLGLQLTAWRGKQQHSTSYEIEFSNVLTDICRSTHILLAPNSGAKVHQRLLQLVTKSVP